MPGLRYSSALLVPPGCRPRSPLHCLHEQHAAHAHLRLVRGTIHCPRRGQDLRLLPTGPSRRGPSCASSRADSRRAGVGDPNTRGIGGRGLAEPCPVRPGTSGVASGTRTGVTMTVPADTPTTCTDCGGNLSRRRAAKSLTRCRPCASAHNRAAWEDRREKLKHLRGPFSPLSAPAKRQLPRR